MCPIALAWIVCGPGATSRVPGLMRLSSRKISAESGDTATISLAGRVRCHAFKPPATTAIAATALRRTTLFLPPRLPANMRSRALASACRISWALWKRFAGLFSSAR